MLYIDDDGVTHSWHVGEPLPRLRGRVVRFQADGDELSALYRGLGATEPTPGERIWVKEDKE